MYASFSRHRYTPAIVAFYACISSVSFGATVFIQTNLVSDIPGLAAVTDPNLVNPWGVSFSPTSPFWVSDQVANVSTLYNASGTPQGGPLVVSTPGGPTGQVFNPTTGFLLGAAPATFIFSTLAGNIEAWNGGTTATVMHTTTPGAYTGLTMGAVGTANMLYAANKATGKIDVFDSSFNPVTLSSTAFVDPAAGNLTPYNIQNISGNLWVEYSGARGAPGGFVAEFDTSGKLIQDINDPHLNAPWGVVLAPAGFGTFGNDLLIGNFNDGVINAFNPTTGAFIGTLTNASGNPIANPGLWSLEFRNTSSPNGNTGTNPNALFITAGINNENDGLFTVITAEPSTVPEPSTFGLIALAGCALVLLRRKSRASAS